MNDILKTQGINSQGFGTIAKIPMQNTRLTIEAKAIYAYFCSYAGAGSAAFPSRDKICHDLGIGKDRFTKHIALLVKFGYLHKKQTINSRGQKAANIYTLLEPCPDFTDTENKDTNKSNSLKRNNNNKGRKNSPAFLPKTEKGFKKFLERGKYEALEYEQAQNG